MEPSPPESSETRLLLRHENRSGSRLRLLGEPAAMLCFCHALRESAAAAVPQKAEGETLRLPGIRITADYDYHLSFRVAPDLTPLLAAPSRRARLNPWITAAAWLVLVVIAATVLRGIARVVFGI